MALCMLDRGPPMNTAFARLLLIAAIANVAACSDISNSLRESREARRATMQQSVLGAIPCVTRASEIAFDVPVESASAYNTTNSTNSVRYLGPAAELTLYPSGKPAKIARDTERVRFAFYPRKADTTEVRFNIDAIGDRRQALEQLAATTLEQCAATLQ